MTVTSISPTSRRRCWVVAAVMLLCIVSIVFIRSYQSAVRVNRLVADVEQVGGNVTLEVPNWKILYLYHRFGEDDLGNSVSLPADITPEWLVSHDYLTDLPLGVLQVEDASQFGPELEELIARHPLRSLISYDASGADQIAALLMEKSELKHVTLRRSDLTDAGLHQLPIEQLETLEVEGTQVTADGLRELTRLRRFFWLCLDGRQISPDLVAQLEQSETRYYMLLLVGLDVNDDTLRELIAVLEPHPTHKLRDLMLENTSVTVDGVHNWRRALPSIKLHTPGMSLPGE